MMVINILAEVNTLVQPHIYNENAIANYAIVGQNLSLDCRVSVDLAINFTVTWKIPDRRKLEVCFLFLFSITFKIRYCMIIHSPLV